MYGESQLLANKILHENELFSQLVNTIPKTPFSHYIKLSFYFLSTNFSHEETHRTRNHSYREIDGNQGIVNH